jgi:hypothetical protein
MNTSMKNLGEGGREGEGGRKGNRVNKMNTAKLDILSKYDLRLINLLNYTPSILIRMMVVDLQCSRRRQIFSWPLYIS